MTGKEKLLEALKTTPNSQIHRIINLCPKAFGLRENLHLGCSTTNDNSDCSECWKLALEEEIDE